MPYDVNQIIKETEEQIVLLSAVIELLQGYKRADADDAKPGPQPKHKGRPPMTASQREAQSKRMKAAWAKKRAAGHKTLKTLGPKAKRP